LLSLQLHCCELLLSLLSLLLHCCEDAAVVAVSATAAAAAAVETATVCSRHDEQSI